MPQRRAASALRVSYQRSQRYDDSFRSRRPASTVSTSDFTPAGNNTITSSSGSSWYADILPYNPSNLPDTLADRLKQQRNSFILSAPPSGSGMQGDDLMTRSLFEPRQTPSESCAWPLPCGRSASRTRPVSFHDAPSIPINLPSLDHLLKPSESRKISAPAADVSHTSPLKNLFLQEVSFQHVQPTDSPLLGQYCRLKMVIPTPTAPSSEIAYPATSSGNGVRMAKSDMCSTFTQSPSRFWFESGRGMDWVFPAALSPELVLVLLCSVCLRTNCNTIYIHVYIKFKIFIYKYISFFQKMFAFYLTLILGGKWRNCVAVWQAQ